MSKLGNQELIRLIRERLEENEKAFKNQEEMMSELREVNEKLKESERVKTQFLSNIRNEINNPLSSIMALSETIVKGKNLDHEMYRSVASTILDESRELDYQLNNIFLASELEAGEANPEISKVCVIALINDTVETAQARMKHKNVSVVFKPSEALEGDIYFHTDAEKVSTSLLNLIANAIEFSNDSGEVEIRMGLGENELRIIVTDHGIGIAPEDQEIIFDRFRQLDVGTTKKHRGHGLGLSIAKAAMDLLGGDIKVESELGKGSSFTMIVPASVVPDESEIIFGGKEELFTGDDVELF